MIQENSCIYQGQKIESYMLPCDEMEQDCLDFFHAVFKVALCSTYLLYIPYKSNSRFLDLGCGTGIWVIELVKAYLDAYILGLDISAI
jgi:ubiquinone/menaquinone biosynthesis C-methylase UbiE